MKTMRRIILQSFVLLALFVGGALAGRALGQYCAPSSPGAVWAATLMLPFSLIMGSIFWRGLSMILSVFKIIGMIFGAIFRAITRKEQEAPDGTEEWKTAPGAAALIIMPLLIASVTGGIIYAVVDGTAPIAAAYFAGAGLGFGVLVYLCARLRLLPMGEAIVQFRS